MESVRGHQCRVIVARAMTKTGGFKLAPGLGTHVADMVLEQPVDPDLAQFHPARFLAGPALSAGYGAARILG